MVDLQGSLSWSKDVAGSIIQEVGDALVLAVAVRDRTPRLGRFRVSVVRCDSVMDLANHRLIMVNRRVYNHSLWYIYIYICIGKIIMANNECIANG